MPAVVCVCVCMHVPFLYGAHSRKWRVDPLAPFQVDDDQDARETPRKKKRKIFIQTSIQS